jgi:hypothetical protein
MRNAIPTPSPATSPLRREGEFRDLNKKRRKTEKKNMLLVCESMVEDMRRNQIDKDPSIAAHRPSDSP